MRTLEPRKVPGWAPAAIVLLAAVAVHGRSAVFGFVGLDDEDFLVDDQAFLARSLNLRQIFTRAYMHVIDAQHPYFRPLVTLSYALDAHVSVRAHSSALGALRAFAPFTYHLTNVELHALACLLFLGLLRRFQFDRASATAAALAFAVHPAIVSAVAWIPGRNDSLLTIFILAAWLALPHEGTRHRWLAWPLHSALFGLALFTKETALAFPIVWALQFALATKGGASFRSPLIPAMASIFGDAIAIALRLFAFRGPGASSLSGVTADGVFRHLPLVLTALGQILIPVNPSLLASPDDLPLWPGVVSLALVAIAVRSLPGIRWRVIALGAATFVVAFVPTLAGGDGLVLSSRLYLPACGALLVVAEIVRAAALERRLFVAYGVVTLAALAVFASAYESSFHDRRAFARSEVEATPHSGLAHFCLGQSCQLDGNADCAMAEYRLALALGSVEVVHNNIAVLDMAQARWADAESELRREIAVNPRYGRAYHNLAIVLRREGRNNAASATEAQASALEDRE